MTDAEIRRELADRVDRETRTLLVDLSPDGPPLMLIFDGHLRPEIRAHIKRSIQQSWEDPGPGPKMLVFDQSCRVFQLIDGVWKPIRDAQ